MPRYVDGFLIPIPKKNIGAYRRMAEEAGRVWKKHGAVEYVECTGDDLRIKMGISFSRRAKVKPGETVLFSWITYKSKAHRDRVNARVMKDPAIKAMMGSKMPFNPRRMTYGGFRVLVDR